MFVLFSGLHARCFTYLDALLYSKQQTSIYLLAPDKDFVVTFTVNPKKIFKFYIPENITSAALTIKNISFCDNCATLKITLAPFSIPKGSATLIDELLTKEDYQNGTFRMNFVTEDNAWHYGKFVFDDDEPGTDFSEFTISVRYFTQLPVSTDWIAASGNIVCDDPVMESRMANFSYVTNSSVTDIHRSKYLGRTIPFHEYSLLKFDTTESFTYSYDLPPNSENLTPLSINLTSNQFSVLSFSINDGFDIGGTLHFSMSLKPRVKIVDGMLRFEEEPKNHVVIACLRNAVQEVPSWPNHCFSGNNQTHVASIYLNHSITNQTVYIPYPETGYWYASFRLFCGTCEPCECSLYCQDMFTKCKQNCESNCDELDRCDSCEDTCEHFVVEQNQCAKCDCDGPCRKSRETCESAVVFLMQSFPCVQAGCGPNGNCVYTVSEGFAYSTCICSNNYKGV